MINILLLIIFIVGIILGYKYGVHVILYSFVMIFISMIISSFISKYICDLLYKFLPFFNLNGKSMGLKSLNILIYRVVIYLFLILLFVVLIDTLSNKLKIKGRLVEHMVEASKTSQIIGAITSLFLSFIVSFNILLIIGLPNINIKNIEGKYVDIVYSKVPFASKNLSSVYNSYSEVKELINSEENNKSTYKDVNDQIINLLVSNNVISEDKISSIENKLVGTKVKKIKKTTTTQSEDEEYEDDYDDEEFEDEQMDDYEEYDDYEDGEFDDYSEEDYYEGDEDFYDDMYEMDEK